VSKPTEATLGPLLYPNANGGLELNIAGCIEVVDGNATCATAYATLLACESHACACLPITDDASYAYWLQCTSYADSHDCAGYASAAACADPEGGAHAACFSGMAFQDLYNTIVPLFCGGAGDASGD
jgi:hypothetical protein